MLWEVKIVRRLFVGSIASALPECSRSRTREELRRARARLSGSNNRGPCVSVKCSVPPVPHLSPRASVSVWILDSVVQPAFECLLWPEGQQSGDRLDLGLKATLDSGFFYSLSFLTGTRPP